MSEALYPRPDLARRMSVARRFMDRCYAKPIDLGAISRPACLSRYHFIRVFRRFYGRTPHQYLTEAGIPLTAFQVED
ncbi:MAG: helix-turn-helix transcriptional regulator [Wenzhouxiangellaceae bacterium]